MRFLGRWFALLAVAVAWGSVGWGQAAQGELEAKLVHQPMFLRGLWANDKLRFDAAGQLVGSSAAASPLMSAVDWQRVELKRDKLLLTGRRMAMVYRQGQRPWQQAQPDWVDLKEGIKVEIAAPAGKDYAVPLAAIFSPDLAGLAPAAPEFWQEFLLHGVVEPHRGGIRRGVSPPRALHILDPQFSEAARRMKVAGNVLVSLQVGTDGLPSHVRIVRPLGLGLDENAVHCVEDYRFQPAMQNGVPVSVEMQVEVNFQIF